MKHLKKFENLDKIIDWNLELSDDNFNKYVDMFDSHIFNKFP